jgi:hypothetical protein
MHFAPVIFICIHAHTHNNNKHARILTYILRDERKIKRKRVRDRKQKEGNERKEGA